MTSETPNLHVLKNLNISKTEKDIEKLKTPLRLVWKCCSDAFQIGSTIFRRRGTLNIEWPIARQSSITIFVRHPVQQGDQVLKCHCNEKIVHPILNAPEQHF